MIRPKPTRERLSAPLVPFVPGTVMQWIIGRGETVEVRTDPHATEDAPSLFVVWHATPDGGVCLGEYDTRADALLAASEAVATLSGGPSR